VSEQQPAPSRLVSTLAGLALVGVGLLILVLALLWRAPRLAAQSGVTCSDAYRIDRTLPTGARWEMCWEHRALEGIVFHDITFTPPGGPRRLIIATASLAQVHVPYDDNGARFHDISDYGFGGPYLQNLTPAECPDGTLLPFNGKNVLCLQQKARGYAQKYYGRSLQGYELSLFSVSTSGDYNYIPQWVFRDDGTIAPSVGAAGQIQRYTTDPSFGWVTGPPSTIALSHFHNYWWRLDFDIDGMANDLVEEIQFNASTDRRTRTLQVTPLTTEAGRTHDPTVQRSWRIRDTVTRNAEGSPISYHIEGLSSGHDYQGPDFEPFAAHDLYVTAAHPCERFPSHNPAVGGCTARDITGFLNGENTNGADLVVWYAVGFHHLPRAEDEAYMDVHWDGFTILPRDWTANNPLDGVSDGAAQGTATPTPTVTPIPTQTPTATPTTTGTPVACSNVLADGGFETGEGWSFGSTPYAAGFTTAYAHAGAQALRAGLPPGAVNRLTYSSAFQTVTIPANATSATLTYWERPGGGSDGGDLREALLLDTSYSLLRTLERTRTAGTDEWQPRTFDISAYRGRTVVVYVNVYNNGSGPQFVNYYDEMAVTVCTAAGAEPPPPAAGLLVTPQQMVLTEEELPRTLEILVEAGPDAGSAGTLAWEARSDVTWINVAPAAGQTPGRLTVTIDKGPGEAAVYAGTVHLARPDVPDESAAVQVVILREIDVRSYVPFVDD
jgi:hypothetical protein